jgi:hypothetical protein
MSVVSDRSLTPTPDTRQRRDSDSSSVTPPQSAGVGASGHPKRPSPLSHSRAPSDASDSTAEAVQTGRSGPAQSSAPVAFIKPKKTLGSKLRRALSMSALNGQVSADSVDSIESSAAKGRSSGTSTSSSDNSNDNPPTPPQQPANYSSSSLPKSRRFNLLDAKLNSSTDNISISSTVSSASMMIRKLGTLGGRFGKGRASLKGISNLFNRDDSSDVAGSVSEFGASDSSSKLKKKDRKKAAPATASVAHVTAEVERAEDERPLSSGSRNGGMTPAAALVQHYAEQQARQQAEQHKSSESKGKAKGKKWGFGGQSSSSSPSPTSSSSASVVTEDRVSPSRAETHVDSEDDTTSRFDDSTPRQSVDFDSNYQPPSLPSVSGEFGGSFFEDDTASFGTPATPGAVDDDGSMYEGKLPLVPVPRHARPVRGILKSASIQVSMLRPVADWGELFRGRCSKLPPGRSYTNWEATSTTRRTVCTLPFQLLRRSTTAQSFEQRGRSPSCHSV